MQSEPLFARAARPAGWARETPCARPRATTRRRPPKQVPRVPAQGEAPRGPRRFGLRLAPREAEPARPMGERRPDRHAETVRLAAGLTLQAQTRATPISLVELSGISPVWHVPRAKSAEPCVQPDLPRMHDWHADWHPVRRCSVHRVSMPCETARAVSLPAASVAGGGHLTTSSHRVVVSSSWPLARAISKVLSGLAADKCTPARKFST